MRTMTDRHYGLEVEPTSRSPAGQAIVNLWSAALTTYCDDCFCAWVGFPPASAVGDDGLALVDLLGQRRQLVWLCSFLELNPEVVATHLLRRLKATGERQPAGSRRRTRRRVALPAC